MSKTIAKYKCKECDDIFTATSEEYISCKCGKCCVKPTEISTSYKDDNGRGHNFTRLSNEWNKHIINDITYFYADDFYIMIGDILNLFNEIKSLCKDLDFDIYESFEKDEEGNEFLSYISYTRGESISRYSNESNEVEFTITFKGKDCDEEKFKTRLLKFKDFLHNIKDGKVTVSNRKQMTSNELNLEWERTQLKEYDYTFYF